MILIGQLREIKGVESCWWLGLGTEIIEGAEGGGRGDGIRRLMDEVADVRGLLSGVAVPSVDSERVEVASDGVNPWSEI